MTREEVVKWLESLKKEIGKTENRTLWHYAESIDIAIKAPQAKTDGDLIRRSDAIGACAYETIECYEARKAIRNLPSAEPKTGHWYIREYEYFTCSECGEDYWNSCDSTAEAKELLETGNYPNYCPNCGAKMEEEEE